MHTNQMTECSDMDLITQALLVNQDPNQADRAFEELVNRYKNLVYSIILRKTNNHQEADDTAQDVFLKVYKNLASYTPEFRFSTWVMRITTNHIIDLHRKKRLEAVSYESYVESGGTLADLGTSASPEATYIQEEASARLAKLLDGLPNIYKTPVILYHQNGLSYNEIADHIGEPISKVKNRIFRGRKLLKGLLTEGE